MKTEKYQYINGDYYYYYKDHKTYFIYHGLINIYNKKIGYHYHEQKKGLWLDSTN